MDRGIPDYRGLMQPVLDCLGDTGGEMRFASLLAALPRRLSLTQEQTALPLASGRETVFSSNLRWAVCYLAAQGKVTLNADGSVITVHPGWAAAPPVQVPDHRTEAGFAESPASPPTQTAPAATAMRDKGDDDPRRSLLSGVEAYEQTLQQQLIGLIHARAPKFFEQLIIDLLLAMGYGVRERDLSRRLGCSKDGGVDGIIQQDELGLDYFYIQAKRYRPGITVPIAEVRDFAGSLEAHKSPKGVFVTTSRFTAAAYEFVDAVPRRIILVNGERLAELMLRHDVGVLPGRSFHIKQIDRAYFGS